MKLKNTAKGREENLIKINLSESKILFESFNTDFVKTGKLSCDRCVFRFSLIGTCMKIPCGSLKKRKDGGIGYFNTQKIKFPNLQ